MLSLGMLADDVRRARVGDTVSYARVLERRRRPALRGRGATGCAGCGCSEVRIDGAAAATLDETVAGITPGAGPPRSGASA